MPELNWNIIIVLLVALLAIYMIWNASWKNNHMENFDAPKSILTTTISEAESGSISLSPLNKLPNTNYNNLYQLVQDFMKKNKIPSGQVCVIQNNSIVYQNNYGNINCEGILSDRPNRKVTNTDLFRIASSSKAITGMGITILVDKGLINLDQSAFDILAKASMIDKSTIKDNRIMNITVRQLLRHEGGWDSSIGIPEKERTYEEEIYDPQYDALRIASRDKSRPATALEIIQYMITKSLNFKPGEKYVYSNFGYNVLGR